VPPRAGLVWPVRVDPSGSIGPTKNQARGTRWRRTSRGLYVPAVVDGTSPEQRIVEAAAVLPEFGGVTGWAALRWGGGAWFDGTAAGGRTSCPVVLATGYRDVLSQAGITISQERLGPTELIDLDGLPLTSMVRSVVFEMRYAPTLRLAVVALDMAMYNDLVSLEEVTRYALSHPGWTGIPQARRAIPLAEENSWSPWETRMRLVWMIDAGLPRPLCNVPVFDRLGNHIGTPDILDEEAGVVGEYDGSLHLEGPQRRRDVRREDRFRRHGLEYFTMLAGDAGDPTQLVDRMLATRRRARRQRPSARSWTLDRPAWWTSTDTVRQRRELDAASRARMLRLRRQTG
jgi:hypothetical protein